jgi:hypothetical protein
MALKDPKSSVRASAFDALARMPQPGNQQAAIQGLLDSSYSVMASALSALLAVDTVAAVKQSEKYLNEESDMLRLSSLAIASRYGKGDYLKNFRKEILETPGYGKFYVVPMFSQYLLRSDDYVRVKAGLDMINSFQPESENDNLLVMFITQTKRQIGAKYAEIKKRLENSLASETDPGKKQMIQDDLLKVNAVLNATLSP